MYGLQFSVRRTAPRVGARADVALLVGWGGWRASARCSAAQVQAWRERFGRAPLAGEPWPQGADALPLAFDNWESFDAAADWRARPLPGGGQGDLSLALALRDFFANGGRRAQVLLLGDPWPMGDAPADAAARLLRLLPDGMDAAREAWRGVQLLRALEECALLLLPDLPELFAQAPRALRPAQDLPDPPEVFVACAERLPLSSPARLGLRIAQPRVDAADTARWRAFVQRLAQFLALYRRDAQALLALPLPTQAQELDPPRALAGLHSSFVQVAWPWLRPLQAPRSADGLVAPDGALAGLIAQAVLGRGLGRSAAGLAPAGVYQVEPLPPPQQRSTPAAAGEAAHWSQLLCLFAPGLQGIELLSDRSLSDREGWRAGAASRLMGQLLREARQLGEAFAFESNGEVLWRRVTRAFEALLGEWWAQGWLRGREAREAFSVRCDRSCMTQADLDAGRLLCLVAFQPAVSLERLRIELVLRESAGLSWREVEALPEVSA